MSLQNNKKMLEVNKIHHGDCLELMNSIPDGSVDVVLTDPPYKYLKNQKLEVDFDEHKFFAHVKRILKKDGFIVLFGRGTSFYRWNTMLADMGFTFKEEIIWDKQYCSSALLPLTRRHETVSIFCKGNSQINRVKIPYLEMKADDVSSIITDLKRLISGLKNSVSLPKVIKYLETGIVEYDMADPNRHKLSGFRQGRDRAVGSMHMIEEGLNEKSIIKQVRDHYTSIHPTQKPVRLLERLLALVSKPGDHVLDPFSGSGSTFEACMNTGRICTAIELDEEYHGLSVERNNKPKQGDLFSA